MSEKRRSERHRVLKSGTISYELGTGMECAVRNVSEHGALLESQTDHAIPNEFSLLIKPEGTRRQCRVVWRTGRRCGVAFV